MINAVIIEDTLANRETFKKILSENCPNVRLVGEAEDVEGGYQLIKHIKPDLAFLDIQLDKETTFDLLELLWNENAINFEIIFITGHGNYENVTRAIEYSALDFIHKPIDKDKLVRAVEKAEKRINHISYNQQIEVLLEHLERSNSKSKRIAIHLLKGVVEFICVDEIKYLEADGVVTHFYMKDNSKLTAVKNLGHYARLLTTDYNFFQVSNDKLVNLDFIKRYNHSELAITLNDGSVLFASRRGGQDFKKFLNESKDFGDLDKKSGLGALLKNIFKP